MDSEDVLWNKGGLAIGAVFQTAGGLWMAIAKTRAYGSMNEVAKGLPSKDEAVEAALAHSRRYQT
ncbi:hypothetical protein [Streptomyces cacaoi]|uniref:hypothetical protein n=1 Tax=Streptomyces cacaoi TaxID=1898 RepID=UPI0011F36D33|nr:hypothetical protein [Streptomyces cacaoi]